MLKDKLKKKKPLISFEVFPPKKVSGLDEIYKNIDQLKDLNPDFFSVTYGAGGTMKDATIDVTSYINQIGQTGLAHLTGITSTKKDIQRILNKCDERNIKNILALRGDRPDNQELINDDFNYASELIQYIKSQGDYSVGAAFYPETHLESDSFEEDLLHLKRKVDSGADFLISQLFFDNSLFYKYLARFNYYGINVPVIAGIFPVTNSRQVKRVLELTDCTFPEKFKRILYKYGSNDQALRQAGIAFATNQIIDLLSWGIDGIHIYTMNRPEVAREIMNNIEAIRGALNNEYHSQQIKFK